MRSHPGSIPSTTYFHIDQIPHSHPSSSCLTPHPLLLPPHHQIVLGNQQPCPTLTHPQILKIPSTSVSFPQRHRHGLGHYSGPLQILRYRCQISLFPSHYRNHLTKFSLSIPITTHLQVLEPQVSAQTQAKPNGTCLGVSPHNPRCHRHSNITHLWAGRIPQASPSQHSPSNPLGHPSLGCMQHHHLWLLQLPLLPLQTPRPLHSPLFNSQPLHACALHHLKEVGLWSPL